MWHQNAKMGRKNRQIRLPSARQNSPTCFWVRGLCPVYVEGYNPREIHFFFNAKFLVYDLYAHANVVCDKA